LRVAPAPQVAGAIAQRLSAQRLSPELIQGCSVHPKDAGNVHDRIAGSEPLDRFAFLMGDLSEPHVAQCSIENTPDDSRRRVPDPSVVGPDEARAPTYRTVKIAFGIMPWMPLVPSTT
jgi:hypothetical protein